VRRFQEMNIDNTAYTRRMDAKADFRKDKINELCWNEVSNMYFDYDFVNKKQFHLKQQLLFSRYGPACVAMIRLRN
jgi:neutral trehalase